MTVQATETSLTDARIRAMTAAGFWPNETLEHYLDRWLRELIAQKLGVDPAR